MSVVYVCVCSLLCIQFLTNTITAQSGLMRAYGTVIPFRKIRIYIYMWKKRERIAKRAWHTFH